MTEGLPEKSSQDGRLVVYLEEGRCVQVGEATIKLFGIKGARAKLLIQAPMHVEIVRETAKNKTKKQRDVWQADDVKDAEQTPDQQCGIARRNAEK